MAKKIYIGASEASNLLSAKLQRPVSSEYIRKLAKRKKQPVRTQQVSNRLLYHREDILAVSIKAKQRHS